MLAKLKAVIEVEIQPSDYQYLRTDVSQGLQCLLGAGAGKYFVCVFQGLKIHFKGPWNEHMLVRIIVPTVRGLQGIKHLKCYYFIT